MASNESDRIVDTYVDAGFGVVQFMLESGDKIQYTRQVGSRIWKTQHQVTKGGNVWNYSLTNKDFNDLIRRLDDEKEDD